MPDRSLFATLIGINAYPQAPLRGCVTDALNMDRLLRELVAQQDGLAYRPLYFLAPANDDDSVRAYREEKAIDPERVLEPTFSNVTREAFRHFKNANDGDICLLYYSGHGSQADAPEEFWHTKPDRQNETIVCVDSRDAGKPDARDVLDKELAYLIWEALKKNNAPGGRNVHCLVVMDCCHSGNNMRAAVKENNDGLRYRYEVPSSKNKIPLNQYIGYGNKDFYRLANGRATISIARYVQLSASRDAEKAQETVKGGLFTRKLIDALRSGGTAKSYRELVQSLTVTVNGDNPKQNPVAEAREDADLDVTFLGKDIKPYRPSFEVRYKSGTWVMYGGALHGIVPSSGKAKTTVTVAGMEDGKGKTETGVEVKEVDATTSVLDAAAMASVPKNSESLRAVITRIANAKAVVGVTKKLKEAVQPLKRLKDVAQNLSPAYFTVDFNGEAEKLDYLIHVDDAGKYFLSKAGSENPLFLREGNAEIFLKDVETVCKWENVRDLKNTDTQLKAGDFTFGMEKVEGQAFTKNNTGTWDSFEGIRCDLQPDVEELFRYRESEPLPRQPAFRLSVSLSEASALQECYVGALYLDPLYGINATLLPLTGDKLVKGKGAAHLRWNYRGDDYQTILLQLDKEFTEHNVYEVTGFLKIFVSTKEFTLERYQQKSLKLDPATRDAMRGADFAGIGLDDDATEKRTDWTVFTFPFRIVWPGKEKTIGGGAIAEFGSFAIEAPPSFSATAFAATGSDVQAKLRSLPRSADGNADAVGQMILPPENLWGDATTEAPLAPGLSSADNAIGLLELTAADDATGWQLPPGETIKIIPDKQTRSLHADGLEETVVPFGYDPHTRLYFPLGYSGTDGTIHVHTLPSPTPGKINQPGGSTRSVGSSVKLFFKKLFRGPKVNTLTLYGLRAGEPWEELTTDPAGMKQLLAERKAANVVLLLHGILGDMKHIVVPLKETAGFSSAANFVLTYDYENLSTPIGKTAALLHKALAGAGFGTPAHPHGLCIMAHSMGGLVSRCLVEKEGGAAYVRGVVFVGTPNGGSQMAGLKQAASGLLTHALNVSGPLKLGITGLSFLLKKLESDPGITLEEMTPGSPFMQQMETSVPPSPVPYRIIAGNTLLLKGYSGEDFFFRKVAEALMDDVVYPSLSSLLFEQKPNDMAVTLESMQSLADFDNSGMYVLASDHISYYTESVSQRKMLALLAGCMQGGAQAAPGT